MHRRLIEKRWEVKLESVAGSDHSRTCTVLRHLDLIPRARGFWAGVYGWIWVSAEASLELGQPECGQDKRDVGPLHPGWDLLVSHREQPELTEPHSQRGGSAAVGSSGFHSSSKNNISKSRCEIKKKIIRNADGYLNTGWDDTFYYPLESQHCFGILLWVPHLSTFKSISSAIPHYPNDICSSVATSSDL